MKFNIKVKSKGNTEVDLESQIEADIEASFRGLPSTTQYINNQWSHAGMFIADPARTVHITPLAEGILNTDLGLEVTKLTAKQKLRRFLNNL